MIGAFTPKDLFQDQIQGELNLLGLNPEKQGEAITTQEVKEIVMAISTVYEPMDIKNVPAEYIESTKKFMSGFNISDPSGEITQGFLAFMYRVKDQAKENGVDYTNNKIGTPEGWLKKSFQELVNSNGESNLEDYAKIHVIVGEHLKRAGIDQDNFKTPKLVDTFAITYSNAIEEIIQVEQGCVQGVADNGLLEPATIGDNCAMPQGQSPASKP